MNRTRLTSVKKFVVPLVIFSVFVTSVPVAFAATDTYPNNPIQFIIPFPPGGVTDIMGRIVATKLSERLGKQVVIENHGGAGGMIGLQYASKAAPDGYTIALVSLSYTFKPAFYEKMPFDPLKAFVPVAYIGNGCSALVVNSANVPAKTVKEFIALAKQKPDQLICVASGNASVGHLMIELFQEMTGVDLKIVQFKGAGPANIDLLGGHSNCTFGGLSALLPHVKSGKLRALGMVGRKSEFLPDVPTISEAGVPGYEVRDWWGIVAPAGTPAPIVGRLTKEIQTILSMDDVKKQYQASLSEPLYLGPTEFGQLLQKEITRWVAIVKKANIKLEE